MKKRAGIILLMVLLPVAFIAGLIALDYYNIPSKLGFSIGEINWDIQGTIINISVTIALFVVTFILIQRWDVKRQNNRQEIALLLLERTYQDCKKNIALFNNPNYFDVFMKKTDFNGVYTDSPVDKFAKSAFQNEGLIMQFCTDGVLTSKQMKKYFEVQSYYLQHLTISIPFYDDANFRNKTRELAEETIEQALKEIELLMDKRR